MYFSVLFTSKATPLQTKFEKVHCVLGGFTYQWENFKVVFLKSTLYFLVAFVFLITKI